MPVAAIRHDPLQAYDVWRSMNKRCYDPKTNGYERYGGRGITVCDSWHTYENFIADMGSRPSASHQLDRKDNDKGYTPNNCRWVTATENVRNSSAVRLIEWDGEALPIAVWAKRLGFSPSTFATRLNNWSLERAMTQPHGPTGPKRTLECN